MRCRADLVALVAAGGIFATACEFGRTRAFSIIPGPAVPNTVSTLTPYVWDSRAELEAWVNNSVTHSSIPLSVVGDGVDAAIRIERPNGDPVFVLRGPDFDPPVEGVTAVRIKYRWQPRLSSATSVRDFRLRAFFEALNAPSPSQQPAVSRDFTPAADWTEADFVLYSAASPLIVKYVYLTLGSANAGEFNIDSIALVR